MKTKGVGRCELRTVVLAATALVAVCPLEVQAQPARVTHVVAVGLDGGAVRSQLEPLVPALLHCASGSQRSLVLSVRFSADGHARSFHPSGHSARCFDTALRSIHVARATDQRWRMARVTLVQPDRRAAWERLPRQEVRREPRLAAPLVLSGAVSLAGGYLGNLVAGLFAGAQKRDAFIFFSLHFDEAWSGVRTYSAVPVVGPWLQLASRPNGFRDDFWGVFLVGTGLVQAAGLSLLVAALVDASVPRRSNTWAVLPEVRRDLIGMRLNGSF